MRRAHEEHKKLERREKNAERENVESRSTRRSKKGGIAIERIHITDEGRRTALTVVTIAEKRTGMIATVIVTMIAQLLIVPHRHSNASSSDS